MVKKPARYNANKDLLSGSGNLLFVREKKEKEDEKEGENEKEKGKRTSAAS